VIEPAVPDYVPQRPDGASLRIPGPEHHPAHPGQHERPRAHRARLHGDHQGAAGQLP